MTQQGYDAINDVYDTADQVENIAKNSNRVLTQDEALFILSKILLDNQKILCMIKEIADSVPPDGETQLDLLIKKLHEGEIDEN